MIPDKDHYYKAIAIVSPMCDGEEQKDQDRAVWFEESQTACVCDGVTSSPYAVEAADLVTLFSPAIFLDDVEVRLRAICDLLTIFRAEKLRSDILVSNSVPTTAQEMIQNAARQSIENSYQTTLVAARFTLQAGVVGASIVRCGDSMFLGFDSRGQLLIASPENLNPQKCSIANKTRRLSGAKLSEGITFGPGDELLSIVLGTLEQYPRIADRICIQPEHHTKWLVCQTLDRCTAYTGINNPQEGQFLHLWCGDCLVVPSYLVGRAVQIGSKHYINVPYSRAIRKVKNYAQVLDFHRHSTVTAVLPDHFYTGGWTYFQDRFPVDAQFILGSDGFYECFKDPASLWQWLNKHKQDIRNPKQIKLLLNGLHQRLRQEHSDDDISFVWVYPSESNKYLHTNEIA
ncbi:MAG: hypothetical protein ACYTF1_22460 [Planctomycetota bacterium]|jgi:serine/threonine protein phosphatase PrpC